MAVTKGVSRVLNVNREPSRPKKRRKFTLTFDEAKRKDFLTGFRKRKKERKEKAQEELKKKLADERRRVKQEVTDKYKKLLSNRDIPELEELLSQHKYEDDGKKVSILELNVNDLAPNTWIGENRSATVKEEAEEDEDDEDDESEEENISGMELKQTPTIVKKEPVPQISKRDLIKEVKKKTMKSKVSKIQQRLDKQKNKKKSAKQKLKAKSEKMKKKKHRTASS